MAKYQTASYMMLCKFNDFASKFLIPAKFVKKYREIAGLVSVTLETDSGKSCDVQIKRIDGDLYMKDGWHEFSMDNDLTENDFLIFRWLQYSSSFKVSIYGANCCLKHPISPTTSGSEHETASNNVDGSMKGIKRGRARPREFDTGANANKKRQSSKAAIANDVVTDRASSSSKLPCMEIKLKSHHQSRVSLKKELWNAGDMRKKKYVVMEYAATRDRRCVELDHRSGCRTDLAKGWRVFREANGMVYGKNYSLEFNPNKNVIRVDEVK